MHDPFSSHNCALLLPILPHSIDIHNGPLALLSWWFFFPWVWSLLASAGYNITDSRSAYNTTSNQETSLFGDGHQTGKVRISCNVSPGASVFWYYFSSSLGRKHLGGVQILPCLLLGPTVSTLTVSLLTTRGAPGRVDFPSSSCPIQRFARRPIHLVLA